MNYWNQIKIGLKTYGEVFNYLFNKKLWWFLIFPLFINIFLFLGGNALIGDGIETLKTIILDWTKIEGASFWGSEFLNKAIQFTVSLMVRFLFFILFAYFGGYIVLIVLSPVLAYLSEKTEKISSGKDYPFNFSQFMKDIARGIMIAIRNLFAELGITVIILILTIIPVFGWLIGILSPFILFFVTSYFYGFSYLDYSLERRKLNVRQSVKLMRKFKALAITNGSIFAISLLIPMCGASIASFVAIASVIAGSLSIEEVLKEEN
jgi:CysZ protein